MTYNSANAPVYRYYAVDFMSNQILAEIPFQGVSWGRALKGAGTFEGRIPVIDQTDSLNLYETTMPVVTAIFVVRDGVCVWGGIIWTREYDAISKTLNVSASEFTSYFHHRKIWKTWNHQYGATVIVEPGTGTVLFDYGSNIDLASGSSVHLEFYEPSNFRYNGYYRVAPSPAPTSSGFDIVGGQSLSDVVSVEITNNIAYFYTASRHGYITGDTVTVSGAGAPFDGEHTISVPAGPQSTLFTVDITNADIARTSVEASVARPLPEGTYTRVTVTVRTDTYDYVRSLIDATMADFVGSDFPNVYIEPGISYGLNIIEMGLDGGLATIKTDAPHNLALGQAVQIQDLGPLFDGEYEVHAIPADNVFRYKKSGTLSTTAVAPVEAEIISVGVKGFEATLTTSAPHGFLVGQNVEIFCGYDLDPSGMLLNGNYKITATPTPETFKYAVLSPVSIPTTALTAATATVGAEVRNVFTAGLTSNVVTVATETPHGFSPGNSVTVAGVDHVVPVAQKSLDAPNSIATILTEGAHELTSGTSVVVSGLKDVSVVTKKEITSNVVTMTTSPAHNFVVGDVVEISDMLDSYNVTDKQLTSNVATLTTSTAHNLQVGNEVYIEGIYDTNTITSRILEDGVATLTIGDNNFAVNDEISVTGVEEVATVVSKEAVNGIAILTFSANHNFFETQEITVSGVGAPFNGDFTVLSYTDTRILYELPAEVNISPATSSGTVTGVNSIYNGVFTVSARTSTTVSYYLGGLDAPARTVTGAVRGWSLFNGTHTIASVPSTTTITYALTGVNVGSTAVPPPVAEEEIQATVSSESRHLGDRTITAVTRNTFKFSQTITNNVAPVDVLGFASTDSIFNGTRTLTLADDDRLKFALSGVSNVLEEPSNTPSFVSAPNIFNGAYTIVATPDDYTFTYAKTHGNVGTKTIYGRGEATVVPMAVISSFGPYPGNADIQLEYSTRKYSGTNVDPIAYRGFELVTLGEALDTYSDSLDGFEYRIDCRFDPETNTFKKTFVLIPINFPNPPLPGEVSPLSRFGADQLVFEYPGGSITELRIQESGEDSSTRFFAQGETDLGPDVGPQVAIASAEDLLVGARGRRWPLLDETEKVDDVDDKAVLYAYARRYLAETRPPEAQLTLSVNGSIPPLVGTYGPGDWCSLIVNDKFVLLRLASDLEPRDDVIVRKIDSYRVSVPDGTTFPEVVQLNLVAEWEVDKIG